MSTLHDIPDNLIHRIASDDRNAFRAFFDMTYPAVYRFVHYFLSNASDCEDAVSEVFYTVWKQRETLPSVRDLKAWLYTVSRNEACACMKRKEKYFHLSIDDMEVDLHVDAAAVEEKLIEEELLGILNKAISELPERCKLIFLMVREEQLKYREIARILSITEGTVEQQMHIAIRKIRTAMEQYDPTLRVHRRGE
jgi:RNA polymerase sigma-70 factor (ECF subfamily)